MTDTQQEAGNEQATQEGAGEVTGKKERKPRAKTEKAPKLYPQYNEETGEPLLDEEGKQVMGETKMKKPRKPKAPAVPRKVAVDLVCNGHPFNLKASQNDTTITVLKPTTSKEGSKRAERAAALEGVETVQDFFAKGGLLRDIVRYLRTGVVSLTFEGNEVAIAEPAAPAEEEEQAA